MVTTANRSGLQILAAAAVWMTLGADAPPAAAGDYEFTRVVSSVGPFACFNSGAIDLNDAGQVAFLALGDSCPTRGIFRADVAGVTPIAIEGPQFVVTGAFSMNAHGEVAFGGRWRLSPQLELQGIFVGSGGTFGFVVPQGSVTPFNDVAGLIDDSGAVVFTATKHLNTPAGFQREYSVNRTSVAGFETLIAANDPHSFAFPAVAEGMVAVYDWLIQPNDVSRITLLRDGAPPAAVATSDANFRVLRPLHVSSAGGVAYAGRNASQEVEFRLFADGQTSRIAGFQDFPGLIPDSLNPENADVNECGQLVVSAPSASDNYYSVYSAAQGGVQRLFGGGGVDEGLGAAFETVWSADLNNLGQIAIVYQLRNETHERGMAIATPIGGLGGDFNHDGAVSRCDVSRLMTQFGTTTNARWIDGDFNHDGQVSLADLIVQQAHLTTPAAPSAAVPEPTGMVLVIALGVGLLFPVVRRWRRRRAVIH